MEPWRDCAPCHPLSDGGAGKRYANLILINRPDQGLLNSRRMDRRRFPTASGPSVGAPHPCRWIASGLSEAPSTRNPPCPSRPPPRFHSVPLQHCSQLGGFGLSTSGACPATLEGLVLECPATKVLIQLQARLLWRKGTLFSPRWSSSNSISLDAILRNNTGETFDSMFENTTTDIPRPRSAEILVPKDVPLSCFLPSMYVYNEDARGRAIDHIENIYLPNGKTATEAFNFNISSYHFRGNY